jgi:hypothetical protein
MTVVIRRFTPDDSIIEELYASDVASPAQFQEMWGGTPERSAEFKLALAVLEQALEDLEKHRHATANQPRRIYCQAEAWVQSNDRRWPYSFVNVCEMLNLCSDRLRAFALARKVACVPKPAPADDARLSFADQA